ncbi:hypothetical protein, partial [Klebsiella pneumoniae]|uniref:hypothetical protein n=1 Tax=Klebsiella pneumoniae TaxID=573 RepID=UPI003458324A
MPPIKKASGLTPTETRSINTRFSLASMVGIQTSSSTGSLSLRRSTTQGATHAIAKVTANSYREYLDIATQALVEATAHFKLPN